jgi:hypothetical protein
MQVVINYLGFENPISRYGTLVSMHCMSVVCLENSEKHGRLDRGAGDAQLDICCHIESLLQKG